MASRRIKFLANVVKNFRDDKFIDDVNKMYRSPDILHIEHNGEDNPGVVLYDISRDNWNSGFFSVINHLLVQFYICDDSGMRPVVFLNKTFPYGEDHPVNGTDNVWEYYFKQPSGYKYEDVTNSKAVVSYMCDKFEQSYPFLIKNGYEFPEEFYDKMGETYRRHIILQDVVEQSINTQIRGLLNGKKTLGVQIRMGDMMLAPNGHPIMPTLDEYVYEIRQVINGASYEFEQIYLATDDTRAIDRMEAEFPGKVIYYDDVSRVSGIYSAYNIPTTRENHRYLCGVEVLRDMLTLASCDGLLAGMSQVVIAARIAKRASRNDWDYLRIIDKGVYNNTNGVIDERAQKIMSEEIKRVYN